MFFWAGTPKRALVQIETFLGRSPMHTGMLFLNSVALGGLQQRNHATVYTVPAI
jgi:hypothetical protein